jgi:hypothetical protein
MKLCQSCRVRSGVKYVPTKRQRLWKCQSCIDRKSYSGFSQKAKESVK